MIKKLLTINKFKHHRFTFISQAVFLILGIMFDIQSLHPIQVLIYLEKLSLEAGQNQ